MKGLFVDFYDSFSANILADLKDVGLSLDHLYWDDLSIEQHLLGDHYQYIVLGPGPGHIDDYKNISSLVEESFADPKKKYVGICLGHQILGPLYGFKLFQLKQPLHAKKIEVSFSQDFSERKATLYVQFYNSWALKPGVSEHCKVQTATLGIDEAVVALRSERILSYQCHPESVGTSCPSMIFSTIKKFLYDITHDVKNENRRGLRQGND